MGRTPCCEKKGLKRGPWTPEEDKLLVDYIQNHGHGSWRTLPKLAGLSRCGKSCRLRWTNYLRPDIKRGPFTADEDKSIFQLHAIVGNRWSMIAMQLPGRTDNEIKNYWNTHLKKRMNRTAHGNDDDSAAAAPAAFTPARHMAQWETARLEAEARLSAGSRVSTLAAVAATTTSSATSRLDSSKSAGADFFLRMWNSEVGEAFRRSAKSLPALKTEAAAAAPEDCSSASNELEEMEACGLFLRDDFAGEELGLTFHGKLGVFSLFPVDVATEASLDAAMIH